ncbi:hypothetical protein BEL01nite_73360 [Bradyrhizobium elkanii]|nr:hypothetical protein BEL01nite_73360 [Bradyrhizobium elkanii]
MIVRECRELIEPEIACDHDEEIEAYEIAEAELCIGKQNSDYCKRYHDGACPWKVVQLKSNMILWVNLCGACK